MGITNYGYQHHSLYEMGQATQYVEVSTRATAKSFKCIEYAVSQCLLKPFCQVVLLAVTKDQANDDYREKFIKELVNKKQMSPLVSYLYEIGMITSKEIDKGYVVSFWNGSSMIFAPCIPSTRGLRANILILEECRLMKKRDIDSIGIPMLYPRQPEFKNLDKYKQDRSYDELEQVIYITSNRFKNEFFNTLFNNSFMDYFTDKLNKNRVFCVDIFVAIKHGLKTPQWYFAQKKNMNELDFRMEVLNETLGEAQDAYFTLEMFQKNQVLHKPFIPPTTEQFINGSIKNRKKEKEEIRLIFVDFSFADSTSKNENDNTVIGCMSIYPRGDSRNWYRNVEYMETSGGGQKDHIQRRIRELFWDFEADFIVYDNLNGGTTHYTDLTKEYIHPERPYDMWNRHGFTIALDKDYHMMSSAKLEELQNRTVDPQAIPVMIPISANSEWNSTMWQDLGKRLRAEEIAFLVDDLQIQQDISEDGKLSKMTKEEQTQYRMPFVQTMFLINEAINLSQEWRSGLLKLSEPRNAMKDRIVAMAYANLIATQIINKLEREAQSPDYDISDWISVFRM